MSSLEKKYARLHNAAMQVPLYSCFDAGENVWACIGCKDVAPYHAPGCWARELFLAMNDLTEDEAPPAEGPGSA